jgi:hypothetical protein
MAGFYARQNTDELPTVMRFESSEDRDAWVEADPKRSAILAKRNIRLLDRVAAGRDPDLYFDDDSGELFIF